MLAELNKSTPSSGRCIGTVCSSLLLPLALRKSYGYAGFPTIARALNSLLASLCRRDSEEIRSRMARSAIIVSALPTGTGGETREGSDMRHSVLAGTVLLATIIAFQASQTSSATGILLQTSKSTSWKPPRTDDGQPDLQGVWLNNSATPLERPKALEGRPSLTDAELPT
jgi:hypothetical protein